MAARSIVEIAPRGDVVLVLDNVKLRVQSQVLALASPVFKAMLEPIFQEGSKLASSGFAEIPLPDDDPLPTQTVCQILHLQFDVLDEHLRADDILNIAVVTDKYRIFKGLSSSAYYWISRLVDVVDDGDRARLFPAAFLLNQGELFRQLSYDLVMKSSTLVASPPGFACPETLQAAFAALERQRSTLGESIGRRIEHTMVTECKGYTAFSREAECVPTCHYTKIRGADFMAALGDSNILPLVTMRDRPLATTCTGLRTLDAGWEAPPPCGGSISRCVGGIGGYVPSTAAIRSAFVHLADNTELTALRMCIKCVQNGDIQESGACKKDHST